MQFEKIRETYKVQETVRKSLSLSSDSKSLLLNFEQFWAGLSNLFQLALPFPELIYDSDTQFRDSLKKFCSSAYDRDFPFYDLFRKPGVHQYYSLCHSVFLFRKVIPASKPSIDAFISGVTRSSEPDHEFADFCDREIDLLFPNGWDEKYYNAAFDAVIPTKSCFEVSRKHGGAASYFRSLNISHFDYVNTCCHDSDLDANIDSRISCVESGGKFRLVSVPSGRIHYLRPLHNVFYDHLSRKDFILRGEATGRSFGSFSPVAGEVFVSGDYESATDNLNSWVQLRILDRVLQRCRYVPESIKSLARSTLRVNIHHNGKVFVQTRGQMMGNLLSFPLLCLVNYLSFRFAIRRKVPVKINGDDIVFRCTPDERDRWFNVVERSGLVVSKGKTLVNSRCFSLNSCIFTSGNKCRSLPFVRSKAIFNLSPCSLGSGFKKSFPNFVGERLRVGQRIFLSINRPVIYRSRASLLRGHGMNIPLSILGDLHLKDREIFYLSLPFEPPVLGFEPGYVPSEFRFERIRVPHPSASRKDESRFLSSVLVSESFDSELVLSCREEFPRPIFRKPSYSKFKRFTGLSMSRIRLMFRKDDSFFKRFIVRGSKFVQLLRDQSLRPSFIQFVRETTQSDKI